MIFVKIRIIKKNKKMEGRNEYNFKNESIEMNNDSGVLNSNSTSKNINELKYLNTKYCDNFGGMFYGCSSLPDIKGLEKWNVSNANNFGSMFSGCSSLKKLNLNNFNTNNVTNMSYMFNGCSSLSDIKGLEKWNVSNGNNFECMFSGCSSLNEKSNKENKNMVDNLSERVMELRIENSKHSMELIDKTSEIKEQIEKIKEMKGELLNEFYNKIDDYKIETNKAIKSFNEFKNKYILNVL